MRAFWLIAALLAVTLGLSSQGLAATSCSSEAQLRSISGTTKTAITFQNRRSASNIQIFWLNYSGQRVLFATIVPKQNFTVSTFLTHPWVVTDAQGNCIS